MTEEWYEGLPDDAFFSEIDRIYIRSMNKIKEGISNGLDFDTACKAIDVGDEELKKNIIDNALKAFIADLHFAGNVSLEDLSKRLNVSIDRLKNAIQEMFEDVEKTAIKSFLHGQEEAGS